MSPTEVMSRTSERVVVGMTRFTVSAAQSGALNDAAAGPEVESKGFSKRQGPWSALPDASTLKPPRTRRAPSGGSSPAAGHPLGQLVALT